MSKNNADGTIIIDPKFPFLLQKGDKLGARGICGQSGTSPFDKVSKYEKCLICGENVVSSLMEVHKEKICPFLPTNCDLCSEKVNERQFVQAHKINDCPKVISCAHCLTYYCISFQHCCPRFPTEIKFWEDTMPLLRKLANGKVSIQVNNLSVESEQTLDLDLFNKGNEAIKVKSVDIRRIDEIITLTFRELPDYTLDIYNHKTLLGCGDQICFKYLLYKNKHNGPSSTDYRKQFVSTGFRTLEELKTASNDTKGIRLIRSDKILWY